MDFNYLLADELAERAIKKKEMANIWEKFFLYATDEDEYSKMDSALILENQRQYGLELSRNPGDFKEEHVNQFKRIAIPLAYRIWKGLIAHNIISVQPFFTPKDNFYHLEHTGMDTVMQKTEMTSLDTKMKAVWSHEAVQDLRSCNGIDAEAELTAILAQEFCLELDRRIVTNIRNNAATKSVWDFNLALGDTIMEKYESLYVELVNMSRVVEMKNGRGSANWIVTSPEVASIFETATVGFESRTSDWFTSSLGIHYVGTINGRWKLYKDPLFPPSSLVIGYKGNHTYDAGYFFCPHTLVKLSGAQLDDFTVRKNLFSGYIDSFTDANFYGRMNITNFII